MYRLEPKAESKKPGRKGLLKCKECRKQFTVMVGTIFSDSHIPLHKWLMTFYLMCSSKKGISAHQIHRMLGVTYKSAWFMCHRVRYALDMPPLKDKLAGIVEIDETYVGGKNKNRHADKKIKGRGAVGKAPVVSLVERGGRVRSLPVKTVSAKNLKEILNEKVSTESRIMTDSYAPYTQAAEGFASHETVNHSEGEYVRGDVTTNSVESFFALLKRGIMGTFHHIGEQHLHRYTSEFDFRYSNRKVTAGERTLLAIQGIEGKRLTYQETLNKISRP